MGTRHLIEVRCDGETKIAQYGQWDGYPSGQGVRVLKFLTNKAHKKKWLKALKRCRFFTSDEEIYEMYPLIEKSEDNIPPELHRDTGSKILDLVFDSKDKIYLVDSRGSYGVQYWYTIDMDGNTFNITDRGPLSVTYKLNKLPTEKEFLETCENVG